jgi:5-methylthioadenosine/S-adenosylhomocysteine deaminase
MSDEPNTLVIRNALVLSNADPDSEPVRRNLLIENGLITAVSPTAGDDLTASETTTVIDATDQLVVPGFVNSHYHSHDVLAKGTMEEEFLELWVLRALPPSFPPRSREEIFVRTALGALECLRAGITTVQDMVTLFPFDPEHLDAVIEAYEAVGIRAVIGPQYADKTGIDSRPVWDEVVPADLHHLVTSAAEPDPDFDLLDYLESNYFTKAATHPRISWALAPTAPESCTDAMITRTADLAHKYDLPVFTHIYESKSMALEARVHYPESDGSLVSWMESLGLSGPRLNLVHSVWLLPDEIAALARTNTKVVFNPLSNLKLKAGIPPIREIQAAGISYGLGCDNPSCSDCQNMFQAMKLAATLTSVSHPDALPPQAPQVFDAATRGGARAILKENELGELKPGYRADLFTLDLHDPAWLPLNGAVRQLVYSETGRAVRTVVVDGQVVVKDGQSAKIDEAELRARLADVMPGYLADFQQISERVDALRPYVNEANRRVWQADVGLNRLFSGK